MIHKPVLLNEVIQGISAKDGNVIVDCTFGAGGHSRAILQTISNATLIAMDQDKTSLETAIKDIADTKNKIIPVASNFREIEKALAQNGIEKADRILADLGFSSDQMDESKRGFSFLRDEPLLMNMKSPVEENDLTARELVNTWDEENIFTIIKYYGEERYAKRISRAIVEARTEAPIETTARLVSIIESAVPAMYKRGRIHPATRTFQAIRIAVNDELSALKELLSKSISLLNTGGRISIISFHSLEDRIVKDQFREWKKQELGESLTKKPQIATEEEIKENPRSRSAKLRTFIKN